MVLGDVWDEPRVVELRDSPASVAAGIAVLAAAVAVLTLAFRRHPPAFALAAVTVLPLRVPIEIGGEPANLLVPLYAVIAAGFIAFASAGWNRPGLPPAAGAARWLERVLAATLVLYALQSAYSEDVSNAIENAGFFLAPFGVMFALLAEIRWTRRLIGWTLVAIALVATAVALIAIGQFAARDLFLNPELYESNQLHRYFRVNSVFFDPNILGRYLVLALVALAAYLAWGRSVTRLGLAGLAAAIALLALAFTYSITSFAALIAGLAVLAILRWRGVGALGVAGLGLAALVALAIAGGARESDIEAERGIDSGRSDLIAGGLELAGDRPLAGWGSGSFGAAYNAEIERAEEIVSHSEPITVAAEQGVIGLAVYVALLATAAATLFGGAAGASAARTAIAAGFVALFVHSLGYAGFVIDPATWALLAAGVALRAAAPDRQPAAAPSGVPVAAPADRSATIRT